MDAFVFEPRFARNGRGAPEPISPPLKARSGDTGKGDAAPYVVYGFRTAGYGSQIEEGIAQPLMASDARLSNQVQGVIYEVPMANDAPDTIHVGPWHAARATVAPPTGRQLTVVSLFTGIGGFDLGLELTGAMTTIAQVEIDKHCNAVLGKHWPDVARYTDVRSFGLRSEGERDEFEGGGDPAVDQPRSVARQLGLAPGGVDVVCGGFPCQDLSVAGKRAGLDGARSGLWFEFHRILRELRPRWAIIENVPRSPQLCRRSGSPGRPRRSGGTVPWRLGVRGSRLAGVRSPAAPPTRVHCRRSFRGGCRHQVTSYEDATKYHGPNGIRIWRLKT